jgi:hypothetical protein
LKNYEHTLVGGNIFAQHTGITHLGIQALPGTKFYLNNSTFPITIGFTGIYELEMGTNGYIYSIRFDATSLARYTGGAESDRILIDIIYEGGN